MKIVINEEDYGRVVKTPGAFNVYKITTLYPNAIAAGWDAEDTFVLNRENALRLQEDIRIWLKEHPE